MRLPAFRFLSFVRHCDPERSEGEAIQSEVPLWIASLSLAMTVTAHPRASGNPAWVPAFSGTGGIASLFDIAGLPKLARDRAAGNGDACIERMMV